MVVVCVAIKGNEIVVGYIAITSDEILAVAMTGD